MRAVVHPHQTVDSHQAAVVSCIVRRLGFTPLWQPRASLVILSNAAVKQILKTSMWDVQERDNTFPSVVAPWCLRIFPGASHITLGHI